jgi:MFS transporter, DHA2 family, multidrug resistance protein
MSASETGSLAISNAETAAVARNVNPWLTGIAVLTGTFMVVLDSTVVNVSLSHIAGTLSATIEETTWALTTYLAANAVILPITGWLANYFGRRNLLMLSVASFTLASLFCGLAPTLTALIVFRIIQGASGGMMQPLSQAIMLESFPPHERGEAMALWGIGIVVAPILGPVLGGWLTDNYSWRWVFYINIPIGIAALVMIRRYVFDPSYIRRGSARMDYWGLGLMTVGIGSLQVALDQGQEEDWFGSDWITILMVLAVAGIVLFIIRELVTKHPIVDLWVFKDRTFAMGVVLTTLMSFVLFGSLITLPILLQALMGYSPLQAGFAMAPRGLGTLLLMPIVGLLIARMDARKIVALGFGLGAWTLYTLSSLNLQAGYWDYFWPQLIQGMAFALLFIPLTTTTMDTIPNHAMGNATSIFNLLRNIGGGVGIAIVQTLLARDRQIQTNILGSNVTAYSPLVQRKLNQLGAAFAAQGADPVEATRRAHAAIWGMVQKQAAIMAFNNAFRLLAVIFLVLTPLCFFMRRPRNRTHGVASE